MEMTEPENRKYNNRILYKYVCMKYIVAVLFLSFLYGCTFNPNRSLEIVETPFSNDRFEFIKECFIQSREKPDTVSLPR